MKNINKINYEYVCCYLKQKELNMLDEYIENMNAKTKFNFEDKQGYKYYACYDVVQRNSMPNIVGTYNPHSIHNIKNWLILNRPQCTLLSDIYENAHTLLIFECNKHGEFNMNWTNMQQGQNCPKCKSDNLSEKFRTNIEYIRKELEIQNIELLSNDYKNESTILTCKCMKCMRIFTSTWQCLKYREFGIGCKKCASIRENGHHFNWNGGLTTLNNYLRYRINPWKIKSFKKYEYKCALTGNNKNLLIHHIYGFNSILKETIEELNIDIYKTVEEYSKEELDSIEKLCLEKHYKYGLGICLCSEVHDLFHELFGKGNNTKEQFDCFVYIFNKYNKNIELINNCKYDVQATLEAMDKEQIKRNKREQTIAEKKAKKKNIEKK